MVRILVIIVSIMVFFISCESPLEPVAGSWQVADIENLPILETMTISDTGLILGQWDIFNGKYNYYEYANGKTNRLFSVPSPSSTDNTGYYDAILDDCDFYNGVLWACGNASTLQDYNYYPYMVYYSNGKLNEKHFESFYKNDPYINSIIGYEKSDDTGCYFTTDEGLFRYSIVSDSVDFVSPGYSSLARADDSLYFGIKYEAGSYKIGIWEGGSLSTQEETLPVFNEAWEFAAPSDSTRKDSLITVLEDGIAFVIELSVNDVLFQAIVVRNSNEPGSGEYDYLLVNPLGGPYGYNIMALAGVNKDNLRAVGEGASLLYKNGDWLKEDTGFGYVKINDIVIYSNEYWAPAWVGSAEYGTESLVLFTGL